MRAPGRAASVFVDLAPLATDGSNGGARPFVLELLRRLQQRDVAELHLLAKPPAVSTLSGLVSDGARVHVLGDDVHEPRRLVRLRRRLLAGPDRRSLRTLGATVLFSPLGTAAFHEKGLPHLAIAYDFQELAHPEFFGSRERLRRREFREGLRRADHVVAISEATRRMGIERAGLDPARVTAVPPIVPDRPPLAPEALAERLARLSLSPGAFAVYPANFWPHKNHRRLLAAAARLPGDATIVLCGALEEERERLLEDATAAGLGDRLRVHPFLPDEDVTALLQGARLLVFPSLFEGFGIPVLEAFRLGTPVVCSDLPALRELGQDAARYFNPEDPEAIASAVASLWREPALQRSLVAKGTGRAELFSSTAVVDRYVERLHGLCGEAAVHASAPSAAPR